MLLDGTHRDFDHSIVKLKGASVEDVNFLLKANFLNKLEVFLGHIAREVACDATFIREIELSVRLLNAEYFNVNFA